MAETNDREKPQTNPLDHHRAAVLAARDADGRTRFLVGIAVTAVGFFLFVVVVLSAIWISSPEPYSAAVAPTPNYADAAPRPSAGTAAHATEAVSKDSSEDRELREDGRIYSVALIVATAEIPPGAKLFAQGRVLSFEYADGMRSRRFAIIEDEQEHGKTLMCAMTGEEGEDVFSLYHVGEVVAVSGEYLDTAGYAGWPRVALTNCHVADRQDNVVRPAAVPAPQLAGDYAALPTAPVPAATQSDTAPPLQFEAGSRLYIGVIFISHQPDGKFTFIGRLLLPVAVAGAGSVDQGTKVIGTGTTSSDHPGHVTVTVKGFTVGGTKYALQAEGGGQPGTGPGIESVNGKAKSLEMWFSSASVYQKATSLEATVDQVSQ